MVSGRHKSRKFRRVKRVTPGGRNVTHFERRKPGHRQCSDCGEYLKGVARGINAVVKKMSKTQRRPERPYGGVLCSRCMRKVMIEKAKKLVVKKDG